MRELSFNLVVGITSGLVTAFLVLVVRNVWIAVVVPWFEELVYKDAKIEGSWYGSDSEEPDDLDYVLSLTRRGHTITGVITSMSGIDKGRTWTLEGSFRNLILTAVYGSIERSHLDRGTLTLMLIQNGERLKGKLAFYSDLDHEIGEGDIILGRNAADFTPTEVQDAEDDEETEENGT